MSQSKYGNTQVNGEYVRLPLTFALDYNADYSMSYTNRSLVDKEYVDGLFGAVPQVWNLVSPGELVLDASVTGAVIPLNDDSNDLGSLTNRWRDLYLGSKIDATSELEFFNSGTLSATLSASGEMLIGTPIGGAKLKVRGATSGGFGTYAVAIEDLLGAELFYVDNGGYVGIGGPSNGSALYVKGKGVGYGYNIWLQGNSGLPKLYMFDNGELHIDPSTAYETVKHTSGRWDFPNTVSIGKPIITGNEALYIKGLGNTSATYSMLIENSVSDPILSVRDNSKVYVKAVGGFPADVTFGVSGFTQTGGWRSKGYNRIEYGANDFVRDARPSIEWNTSAAAGQFITGIKNDDIWGIFCSPAGDHGFEINKNTRNIGLSSVPSSDTKLRVRGIGNTSVTNSVQIENLSSQINLRVDDSGTTFIRALNGLVSSVPVQGGIYLTWVSDGGISNARLLNCSVVSSDITFANNYGISGGLGYVKLGDTTALSQFGGGVTNYIRYSRLSQNWNASLDRFPLPADGGFSWIAQYAPHLGRYTIMTETGKQQIFSNSGWTMPIGTSSKNLGNSDDNTVVSATPTQSEVQEISDRLRDTRRVIKALIDHLGNSAVPITLDNTTNIVQFVNHGLQQRHRIKFISGTLPAELSLNTWYYITDGSVNTNDFQISASYGGSAINFSTNGSNIFMQIDYSGMNLLTE